MRRTTAEISIAASWFMFACFAQIWFHQESTFSLLRLPPKKEKRPKKRKTLPTEMFTPYPVRVSSGALYRSWPSMWWFPLQGCNIKTNNLYNYTPIFLRWFCVNKPGLQLREADFLAGPGWGCHWMAVGKQSHFRVCLGKDKPLLQGWWRGRASSIWQTESCDLRLAVGCRRKTARICVVGKEEGKQPQTF